MRYLITGHTGFKGSWLTLLLTQQGHEVVGLSLDPDPGSLFDVARVAQRLSGDFRGDIRDPDVVREAVSTSSADVLVHMAAQPLVRDSYRDPRGTIETNVMGTLNVLEATQESTLRTQLIITTDKVYRNVSQLAGYREEDPLGGDDPYSASKAMADILTHSWVTSFDGPLTAVARAGNVIGGGDVSQERLLPDVIRALASDENPQLRYPQAVRPWQHVLDCLNGYVTLIDAMVTGQPAIGNGTSWNFGPDAGSVATVEEVARCAAKSWGSQRSWEPQPGEHFHEAGLLTLDSGNARRELGWGDRLSFQEAVSWSVQWYRAVHDGADPLEVTLQQIDAFSALAPDREASR